MGEQHLKAALALWKYCEESACYIFTDSTGSRDADAILKVLRVQSHQGLTRTDISNLFGRNKARSEIDNALNLLLQSALVRVELPSR